MPVKRIVRKHLQKYAESAPLKNKFSCSVFLFFLNLPISSLSFVWARGLVSGSDTGLRSFLHCSQSQFPENRPGDNRIGVFS